MNLEQNWLGSFSPRKVAETCLLAILNFLPKTVYLGFGLMLPFYLNPPNAIRRKIMTNNCYIQTPETLVISSTFRFKPIV